MNRHSLLGWLALALMLTLALGTLPAVAAPGTPISGLSASGKKFNFTLSDVNNAKRMSPNKPQLLLSWQTRVRLANEALARDGATLKTTVDEVLARADKKAADCSGQNYTLADLQNLCQPNEGVQACLDRLRMSCIMGQASQQMADSMANAFAAQTAQTSINRMKQELANLEQALFK